MSIESYLIGRLKVIYDAMDRAYSASQAFYGFDCEGCLENCCTTYFFNHTLSESIYLLKGLASLKDSDKSAVIFRAKAMSPPIKKEEYLCPLNFDGKCIIYPFRTMICRLHGLPYILRMPNGVEEEGPGCAKFEAERVKKGLPYRRIDRTPFYTDLSSLEREVRNKVNYNEKFKRTIAEIIRDRDEIFGILIK